MPDRNNESGSGQQGSSPTEVAVSEREVEAAFQQWMDGVAALPAEQQVVAVTEKILALNPVVKAAPAGIGEINPRTDLLMMGFDGKKTFIIEDGAVVGFAVDFGVDTRNVKDISPVRAFTKLKKLGFRCSGVSDLSSIKGMSLTHLDCNSTPVTTLSSLKGMDLEYLNCSSTGVTDLSPLRGMPLVHLSCEDTDISDLSPLIGMKLRFLYFGWTLVSDLSPLTGMPLEILCSETSGEQLAETICTMESLRYLNGKPIEKTSRLSRDGTGNS